MLFNSIDFLFFFPAVVMVYFIIPKRIRYIWLLFASFYFYMSWNPEYALLIAISIGITYVASILIEKSTTRLQKKICVVGSLVSNLTILAVFKYANFIIDNIAMIVEGVGLEFTTKRLDLLLPVGISFYTFQALSYTLDVYRGEIKAEKNPLKYALFVSFFPQLVAGPIERSKNLLEQIQGIESIKVMNFDRIYDGFWLMMWGLFQKLVIADRACLLVDQVITNYQEYGFIEITLAVVLFAFQIYCDFGGYTNIARGAAKILGFELVDNFRQPYLATSIHDFWRRWHISLTSWFTDYLYIPLGGNRKGVFRKYLNILIVFAISGLWHGASWNFVVWGLLHAVFQIVGDIKNKQKKNLAEKKMPFGIRIWKMLITFALVDFAWLFFVANDATHAINLLRQMVKVSHVSNIYELGLNRGNWGLLLIALSILFFVDSCHEKGKSILQAMKKQFLLVRCFVYAGLIFAIVMFGIYGVAYDVADFIYFQF